MTLNYIGLTEDAEEHTGLKYFIAYRIIKPKKLKGNCYTRSVIVI